MKRAALAFARRPHRGQVLAEEALLLAGIVGALLGAGAWIAHAHPDWLDAVDLHLRGFYFALSLPFP